MRVAGILVCCLMAGCAGEKPQAPPAVTTGVASAETSPVASATAVATVSAPLPTVSTNSSTAKNSAPATKAAAAKAAPATAAAPLQKKEAAAPSANKPEAAPPLDMKSLEDKLKSTKAIGVFTKLSLKNQVDDLLDKFRAFHHGQRPPTLADLRQPYDLLLMKVLSLLQDGDPPLAHEISASREALWGILSDPAKFSTTVGAAL